MQTLITWLLLALCSAGWWGKREPTPITKNKRDPKAYTPADQTEGRNCCNGCPSCVPGSCDYELGHEETGQNFHRCDSCFTTWIVNKYGRKEII